MSNTISGFSKLSKEEKTDWIARNFCNDPESAIKSLSSWKYQDEEQQRILDGFTENALANFPLPYSVAPNFMVNGKCYAVPMVIEESSVVAAAASAAKFWLPRGGFHTEVVDTRKVGHVYFRWEGDPNKLEAMMPDIRDFLLKGSKDITANMEKRGGGVEHIELIDYSRDEPGCYSLQSYFQTCESMGANFINSVLERFGDLLEEFLETRDGLVDKERDVEVLMCILSNYTPECTVRAWVECPVSELEDLARNAGMPGKAAVDRFCTAVRVAEFDPYRATTHNKGIMNGIDAVVIATGNDFRAIEACNHAYAGRSGQYRSLSKAWVKNEMFHFELTVPLALGTVGGLTALHPLAKLSLEILGHPNVTELMGIVASVGLAQNFAAVRSLVTTGIQQGHMKMHLTNILNHLGANQQQAEEAMEYFQKKTVSFSEVRKFLSEKN